MDFQVANAGTPFTVLKIWRFLVAALRSLSGDCEEDLKVIHVTKPDKVSRVYQFLGIALKPL